MKSLCNLLKDMFNKNNSHCYGEWIDKQKTDEIKKAYKSLLFYIRRAVLVNPNKVLISSYFSKVLDYSVFPFYWTEEDEERLLYYYCTQHSPATFEKVELPMGYYYYSIDFSNSGNSTKMPWEE